MPAVLWALFFRPVGFDYRSKIDNASWRSTWDWGLFVGGAVPPLIFGVAFGNLLQRARPSTSTAISSPTTPARSGAVQPLRAAHRRGQYRDDHLPRRDLPDAPYRRRDPAPQPQRRAVLRLADAGRLFGGRGVAAVDTWLCDRLGIDPRPFPIRSPRKRCARRVRG